ncbi:pantoate--beta-alanine ligase [soil metagenome]
MVDNLVECSVDGTLAHTGKPFIADSLAKLSQWRASHGDAWINSGKGQKVAFVPTMGALHSGHLELVKRAKTQAELVVVSIFVNPYQFGPTEDFDKYPRTFERDLELLSPLGVDCVFYPTEKEMYPAGRDAIVSVAPAHPLNDTLEGAFRPNFFRGVATVVTKLFTLVQPHLAFFGEKDFQQLLVIKALSKDLNLPLEVVGVPTVREEDGLALSSRNAYLDAASRKLAPVLHQALAEVVAASEVGVSVEDALKGAKLSITAEPEFALQYLAVCNADTFASLENSESLEPLKSAGKFSKPFVVLVAAKLGEVRLIDNIVVR